MQIFLKGDDPKIKIKYFTDLQLSSLFFSGITSTCWSDNGNGSSNEESHWNWRATGLQGTGANISTWSKF